MNSSNAKFCVATLLYSSNTLPPVCKHKGMDKCVCLVNATTMVFMLPSYLLNTGLLQQFCSSSESNNIHNYTHTKISSSSSINNRLPCWYELNGLRRSTELGDFVKFLLLGALSNTKDT